LTSNTVYQILLYIVNKEQSGYITPDEFNDILMPQAQYSYAQYLMGEYQQYQYQRSQARIAWGQNQNVRESLTPIIYSTILNVDLNGISPYPGDYEKTDAMTTIYNYNRIRFASQDRLFSFMNSTVEPIATNPIYLVKDIGFQFYPTTINQARLSYVRTPPPIYWGYTLDGDGLPVWNPATSIDPVWNNPDMLEIITRALKMTGVSLQIGAVTQYANDIIKMGQ